MFYTIEQSKVGIWSFFFHHDVHGTIKFLKCSWGRPQSHKRAHPSIPYLNAHCISWFFIHIKQCTLRLNFLTKNFK